MSNEVQVHNATATSSEPNITLTDSAKVHVRRYIAKQGHGIGLRMSVTTTGCSGLAYKTDLVDAPQPDDIQCQIADDILLFIDPKALAYLRGMEIDHVKEGLQERFVYNNPNQKGACGCGESFLV